MQIFLRKYYAWIIAVALLCSCGMIRSKFGRLPGGYTTLNVSVPGADSGNSFLAWPSVSGGIMIYILGIDGSPFATTIPLDPAGGTTATANISVPNGKYKVYALAWEGSNKLEGQVGCGRLSEDLQLTGGSRSINMTISNSVADCNYTGFSPFSNSGYITFGTNFPPITVTACNGVNTSGCVTASASYNTMSSAKIRAEGFIRVGNDFEPHPEFGTQGVCASLSGSYFATNARIPVGNSSGPDYKFLGTTIAFYPNNNTNCSGTPTKTVYFPGGLVNGSSTNSSYLGGFGYIYVDVGP